MDNPAMQQVEQIAVAYMGSGDPLPLARRTLPERRFPASARRQARS
jgi:hypothetical protein